MKAMLFGTLKPTCWMPAGHKAELRTNVDVCGGAARSKRTLHPNPARPGAVCAIDIAETVFSA
jgi:hypothetical protein